jgi:hypothetical protein
MTQAKIYGIDRSLIYPNAADLCREKTHQGAPDVAWRSLGKVEAYFTVREILPEASKGADGVHWCEFSGFGRFRFAALGFTLPHVEQISKTNIGAPQMRWGPWLNC